MRTTYTVSLAAAEPREAYRPQVHNIFAESHAHLKQVSHAAVQEGVVIYDFCLTLAYSHRYPAHKGNTFLQLQIFIRVCR